MELSFLDPVMQLLMQNPVAAKAVVLVSIARAVNKPLFSLLRSYVDATPAKWDNEALDKVMSSKAYPAVCWFLDYTLSIKMPKKQA